MATETLLTLHGQQHESREKYTYYICGVAGALFAFTAKDFSPQSPHSCQDKMTMLALYFLILSFVSGLAAILTTIQGTGKNKDYALLSEGMANLIVAKQQWREGKINSSINKKTNKEYNLEDIEREIDEIKSKGDLEFIRMENWYRVSTITFWSCHCFLVAGFMFIVLAKSW